MMTKDITDTMTDAEREDFQRRMREWFGLGVTRCSDEDCDCGGAFNPWER